MHHLHKRKRARKLQAPDYAPQVTGRNHHHINWGTARPLVILPGGTGLLQQVNLPRIPGQVGFAGDRPEDSQLPSRPTTPPTLAQEEPSLGHADFIMDFSFNNPINHPTSHQLKQARQAARWQAEVIPCLVVPYLDLMWASNSLSSVSSLDASSLVCICTEP